MKHLANIITLAVLCICIAPVTFAQGGEHYQNYGSRHMDGQAWALVSGDPYFTYSDSLGQSFYHPGGNLHSLHLTLADFFSLDTVPATITIYEDHVYGSIVTVIDTVVPGMNKYCSADVLEGVSQTELTTLRNQVFLEAANGTRTFEQMSTEYIVDMVLPPGNYAFVVRVDGTVTHSYPGGGNHRSHLGGPTNQLVNDPYPQGFALWGGCIGQGGIPLSEQLVPDPYNFGSWLDVDLAFEFSVTDLSTSIPISHYVRGNTLAVPESWNAARVEILDLSGRLLSRQQVRLGDILRFPENQILLVRAVLPDGTFQSEQVSTVGF